MYMYMYIYIYIYKYICNLHKGSPKGNNVCADLASPRYSTLLG